MQNYKYREKAPKNRQLNNLFSNSIQIKNRKKPKKTGIKIARIRQNKFA